MQAIGKEVLIKSVFLPVAGFENRLFFDLVFMCTTTVSWMQPLFYNFPQVLKHCQPVFSSQINFGVLGKMTIILSLFFVCVLLLLLQCVVVKVSGTGVRQISHHLLIHKPM